jgi:TusA-related sulfurtransferase
MPIVRVGLAMRNLATGQKITVKATDPAFEADLAAWSRQTGHRVLQFERTGVQTAVIEKV